MAAPFAGGCVAAPTKVSETEQRQMQDSEHILAPIQITKETIVVDARDRFDYSTAHIPQSVSLQWADFTDPEPAQKGVLQSDTFAIARRLARAGIGLQTPVVVVGRGLSGNGEEGRLAWMLATLGVQHVQFADLNSFRARLTNMVETNGPASVPIWKPEMITSLVATRDEVARAIGKHPAGPTAIGPKFIDCRLEPSANGHVGLSEEPTIPNLNAVRVPWPHFFTKDFRPNPGIKGELVKLGLDSKQRIIVIDRDGVASGAVTMALRAFGFANAANSSGGYQDLLSTLKQ